MSLADFVPLAFYEIFFVAAFAILPYLAYRAEIESVIFGMVALYMCLRVIRGRKKSKLPTEGKSVFITGCDSGFGHMAAIRLDEQGYQVFAGCLVEKGTDAEALKSKCSDRLRIVPLDVTSDESVQAAEQYVRDNLGETYLWAVVNNAGIYVHGDVELCTLETFKLATEINLFGAIRVIKKFSPLVRNSKGRFVIMSSSSGRFSFPGASAYSMTKMGVECVSDCLRMEMVKFGVQVSIIQPGMFGGCTGIHNEQNVSRYYAEVEKSWASSSDDVKSTFSKQYLQDQIGMIARFRFKFSAPSADPVIDAIEDSVSGTHPRYRYLVHGGPVVVDPTAVYSMLYPFLPTFVTDWFSCKVTSTQTTDVLQGFAKQPVSVEEINGKHE